MHEAYSGKYLKSFYSCTTYRLYEVLSPWAYQGFLALDHFMVSQSPCAFNQSLALDNGPLALNELRALNNGPWALNESLSIDFVQMRSACTLIYDNLNKLDFDFDTLALGSDNNWTL